MTERVIPYGRQEISEEDISAVVAALRSDYLTQGPLVPEFERAVASYCDVPYALAVNSATSALHIACLALGLGSGDLLWTTPITFVASANCGLYCGAEVDFVDIDPKTYNMSVDALADKLKKAESEGRLPKIVIPVHLCGQPCEMDRISELANRYGFRIIEDASHAIGGRYRNQPIGNCEYSDITVFSFHPVKIVTTAEGGMAVTRNPNLAHKMDLLRSHGITRNESLMDQQPDGPWFYQQIDLGFNYRMTELQAALGISQMKRLPEFIDRRHSLARRYDTMLADLPVSIPWQHPDGYSGLHLYVIRIQLDKITATHLDIFSAMRKNGIMVNLHYIPVHTQPFYRKIGFKKGQFPHAEAYYQEAISIPMFPNLSEADQDHIVKCLRTALMQ